MSAQLQSRISASGSTDTTTTSNLRPTITNYPLDSVWHDYEYCDEKTWNLLKKGEGLLQRAQEAEKSLEGHATCKGNFNGLMNKSEYLNCSFDYVCEKCKWKSLKKEEHFSQMSKIDELIGLTGAGGCYIENIEEHFPKKEVGLIVNATSEVPLIKPKFNDSFKSCRIPVDDSPSENLYKFFEELLPLMHTQIEKGHVVIVHCWRGVSRSVCIVMAYLMKYQNLSMEEAYNKIKRIRKFMRPSLNFLRQLTHYEAELGKEMTKWRPHTEYYSGSGMTIWIPKWFVKEMVDNKKKCAYGDEYRLIQEKTLKTVD